MYEPVLGCCPVGANHYVNVWCAASVETGVDGCQLNDAVAVGEISSTKPALRFVESWGIVCAVVTSGIG